MELANIKKLLDKYFQGETKLEEENQLKSYFSSENIASELEQYRPLFGYLSQGSKDEFNNVLSLKSNKISIAWISIAASILFFGGIFVYMNYKPSSAPVQTVSELGTFDTPEEAFEQTQKALALLSENVNDGVEGIIYLSEFEKSKKLIFKK